ncbi:hypothetical protein MRX96_011279 [Rhipicephalus microplus]
MRSTSLTPIIPFSKRPPFVESGMQQVITATTAVVARSSLVHFSPGQTDRNLRDPFPRKCVSAVHMRITSEVSLRICRNGFLPEGDSVFFFFFFALVAVSSQFAEAGTG